MQSFLLPQNIRPYSRLPGELRYFVCVTVCALSKVHQNIPSPQTIRHNLHQSIYALRVSSLSRWAAFLYSRTFMLECFVHSYCVISGSVYCVVSGIIPCVIQRKVFSSNILFMIQHNTCLRTF